MLYGDTTGAAAMALVVRTGKTSYNGQLSPRLPANTETLIVASMDVSVLLNELIPAVAKLKVYVGPSFVFRDCMQTQLLSLIPLRIVLRPSSIEPAYPCFDGSI